MDRKYLSTIIILGLCLSISQTTLAYKGTLHPLMTREAINKSKLAETNYLNTELGFKDSLNERFKGPDRFRQVTKSVREWIEQGSRWEDRKLVEIKG